MSRLSGRRVILTGATGGIGNHLTQALADAGAEMALVVYTHTEADGLIEQVRMHAKRTFSIVADLTQAEDRERVIGEAVARLGGIDILINNAGDELTSPYHELSEATIERLLALDLVAPMMLSRKAIPYMRAQGAGLIINMSSLAGKLGPAFQEPYAASKAGLVGFTQSLRATYRHTGIRATVICPGFVDAGIYERNRRASGIAAPALLGSVPPRRVVDAVFRAIERDEPEIIVNKYPVRMLIAITNLFPALGEWMTERTGGHAYFRRTAQVLREGAQAGQTEHGAASTKGP